MKGLLIKDFLVIARQLKIFLLVIPVMAVTGGVSMASLAVLLGAALPMTAIAYDEQSRWDELAVMMPYSKKSLVLSKYVLGYLGMAGAALLFLLAQLILTVIRGAAGGGSLLLLGGAFLSGLLLIAILLPFLFKFGVQKGRFVFVAFLGLAAAGSSVAGDFRTNVSLSMAELLPLLLMGAALLNAGSVLISFRVRRA